MGVERKSLLLTDEEKKNTAYHEAGHALVAAKMPNSDPLHKVTIIPRGMALGVTMQLPIDDRHNYYKNYLETEIAILMGGRIAEELFLNEMSTGAGNDIERATEMARKMVCEWGMSDLGPMTFGKKEEQIFLGREIAQHRDYSEDTAIKIDQEVRKLVNTGYTTAKQIISDNRDMLETDCPGADRARSSRCERDQDAGRGPGTAAGSATAVVEGRRRAARDQAGAAAGTRQGRRAAGYGVSISCQCSRVWGGLRPPFMWGSCGGLVSLPGKTLAAATSAGSPAAVADRSVRSQLTALLSRFGAFRGVEKGPICGIISIVCESTLSIRNFNNLKSFDRSLQKGSNRAQIPAEIPGIRKTEFTRKNRDIFAERNGHQRD